MSRTRIVQRQQSGLVLNTNTIIAGISTIGTGIVLYMVTAGMHKVSATADDVKDVKTVIPFIQHDIQTTQADVKDAKSTAKADLDQKHQVLWSALKDNRAENEKHYETLSNEIKGVQTEQMRVREDLMQRPKK